MASKKSLIEAYIKRLSAGQKSVANNASGVLAKIASQSSSGILGAAKTGSSGTGSHVATLPTPKPESYFTSGTAGTSSGGGKGILGEIAAAGENIPAAQAGNFTPVENKKVSQSAKAPSARETAMQAIQNGRDAVQRNKWIEAQIPRITAMQAVQNGRKTVQSKALDKKIAQANSASPMKAAKAKVAAYAEDYKQRSAVSDKNKAYAEVEKNKKAIKEKNDLNDAVVYRDIEKMQNASLSQSVQDKQNIEKYKAHFTTKTAKEAEKKLKDVNTKIKADILIYGKATEKDEESRKAAQAEYSSHLPQYDQNVHINDLNIANTVYDNTVLEKGKAVKENPLNDFSLYEKDRGNFLTKALGSINLVGKIRQSMLPEDTIQKYTEKFVSGLSDDEKNYINYLYGTYDKTTAADLTSTYFNNKENQKNIEKKDNVLTGIVNVAGSTVANLAGSPLYALEMIGNEIKNSALGTNYSVPTYSDASRVMGYKQAASESFVNSFNPGVAQFLAQNGLSIVQNVANRLAFGGAGLAMMGVQSGADSGYNAALSGASGSQQTSKAVLDGATEILTEKISWGKLDNILEGSYDFKGIAKQFGKQAAFKKVCEVLGSQMVTEFGEEVVGQAVNNLTDWAVMGDKGDLAEIIDKRFQENGGTENAGMASYLTGYILNEVLQAGLGGALSGLVMGGGGMLIGAAKGNAQSTNAENYSAQGDSISAEAVVNAFADGNMTDQQIETLKPGGDNRSTFEQLTGIKLPSTSNATEKILKSLANAQNTTYNENQNGVITDGERNSVPAQGENGRGTVSGILENAETGVERQGNRGNDVEGKNSVGGYQGNYRVLSENKSAVQEIEKHGSTLLDLKDVSSSPQSFSDALESAKKSNKHGFMVSGKSVEDLMQPGTITFMTPDGGVGALVAADGDIEAVFKNPNVSSAKRASDSLMISAVENGGNKLDCYGKDLVKNYNRYGFEAVGKVPYTFGYNPEMDVWVKNQISTGKIQSAPDVYAMKLRDGVTLNDVIARMAHNENEGGFHKQSLEELSQLPTYTGDNAYADMLDVRDALIKSGANSPASSMPGDMGAKLAEFPYKEVENKDFALKNAYSNMVTEDQQQAMGDVGKNHQVISEAQSQKIAEQRAQIDFQGEKNDLSNKTAWTGEDIDTGMRILGKIQEDWEATPKGTKEWQDQKDLFSAWYDQCSEKASTAGQALQAWRKYACQTAAASPTIALTIAQKEMSKINAQGEKTFGDDKWKKLSLTDDEISRINNLEIGDAEGFKGIWNDVTKRIASVYPAKTWEKFVELTHVAMLLNPRTLLRNTLANAIMLPLQQVSGKVSALGQAAVHLFNPNYKPTQSFIVGKEAKSIAKEIYEKLGGDISNDSKYKSGFGKNDSFDNITLNSNFDKVMFKTKEGELPFLHKVSDWNAKRLGNLSKKVLSGDNVFEQMSGEKGVMENLRQFTYGMLELGDRGFVKKNFVDRLASYCQAQGIKNADSVPQEAVAIATEEAMKATFKDDNKMTALLQGIKKNTGVFGELATPFTKTPANVTMRSLDFSPVGIVKGGIDIAKSAKIHNSSDLSKAIDSVSKGLTGTALTILGMGLKRNGFITGPKPDDKDEAAFLEQLGWKPYAFHIGDEYITFDWAQPGSAAFITGAAIQSAIDKDTNLFETCTRAATTFGDTVLGQSTLQNILDIFEGYGSATQNAIDVGLQFPQRFIPSALSSTAKIFDTTKRQTYDKSSYAKTLLNQVESKIPGLSKRLPTKYDVWGDVAERDQSIASAIVNAYINPGETSTYSHTKINDEIMRLFDSTGDNAVFPSTPEWVVKTKSGNVTATAEEYSNLQKATGKSAKDFVESFIEDKAYKNLSDSQKAKMLSEMYSLSKVIGKAEVFADKGYEIPESSQTLYDRYNALGAEGVIQYYLAKANADTDHNSNVSQSEMISYLKKENGLSSEEKGYLLGDASKAAREVSQSKTADVGAWYDYYISLYDKADAVREKKGNKTVSVGTSDQIAYAKALLDASSLTREEKKDFWNRTSTSEVWKRNNPYD